MDLRASQLRSRDETLWSTREGSPRMEYFWKNFETSIPFHEFVTSHSVVAGSGLVGDGRRGYERIGNLMPSGVDAWNLFDKLLDDIANDFIVQEDATHESFQARLYETKRGEVFDWVENALAQVRRCDSCIT